MVVSKNKPAKANGEAEAVFEEFVQASDSIAILVGFQKLKAAVGAENVDNGKELYAVLKSKLQTWKCKSLWEVLDARAKHKEYGNGTICEELQVLVIGSGPIGLRTAIEVALLGARVTVVEKRTTFGRNNVLHLWPFLIQDFRALGAKRFYGKFCAGSLDHISIRILQCMLMKTALLLGVQIYTGVTFEKMVEPSADNGWRCQVNPPFHPASQFDFDMVVGADGKKNVLPDFQQIEMRGSLAIGITLNLVYHGTQDEAAIAEVSGLAYHFKPQFFDELYQKSGVRLENFVYYKNETHYFVMTAVKSSLLARGALLMDYPKPADLLAPQNVNQERLVEYALDAVKFGTQGQLTNVEFVINDRGKPDIAVFDFTSLKKAEHAARIVERKGHRLLMALVGDSLIEPFWPTGSGCARGVLSALDVAWMLRSFAMDKPPLQVLSERENVYKLLSATTMNNLRKKFDAYTINPSTRYIDINLKRVKEVYHLYDSDDPVNADFRVGSPTSVGALLENTKRRLSVTTSRQVKPGRKQRKSSSDELDEKKGRKKTKNPLRRSASRDLDNDTDENPSSKGKASKSKKSLKKLRSRQSSESADEKEVRAKREKKLGRTKSRDTEGSNNSLDTISESPKVTAKTKDEEKEKGKDKEENKENSLIMKRRSTKRWRIFGGTKPPRQHSTSEDEPSAKKHGDKDSAKKKEREKRKVSEVESEKKKDVGRDRKGLKKSESEDKKEVKKGDGVESEKKKDVGRDRKGLKKSGSEDKKEVKKGDGVESEKKKDVGRDRKGLKKSESEDKKEVKKGEQSKPKKEATNTQLYRRTETPRISVKETVVRTTLRQLGENNASPKPFPNSLRTPSELRAARAESPYVTAYQRSISHGAGTLPRIAASRNTASPMKRTNSEFRRKDTGLLSSLRRPKNVVEEQKEVTPKERERKNSKHAKLEARNSKASVSVFDDIKSLSPAAQRTVPLLATLTPDKKDGKYSDGGAVSAVAGIAALVALTTSLAVEAQQPLKEFQIERQKILSSSQMNVKEKIALLNTASNNRNFRRDLSAALDNVDGSPKPVKRYFSFSFAQRNVKQKLQDDSHKYSTLPGKVFSRPSLQSNMGPTLTDFPSALDSALDILIKQYKFKELQNTIKLMLNIFRCISKDPDDELSRRVCTEGQTFRSLVWDIKEARLFMFVSGWMEIGTFILFPKSKTVHEPIRVLMQNYRVLWEQQDLDISCPPFLQAESATKLRRFSDEVFRAPELRRSSSGLQSVHENPGELAKDDPKDTGSHSSDSGMGFSETASEHNIPAVMSLKTATDVDNDVAAGDDVVGSRGSSRKNNTEANPSKRSKLEKGQTLFNHRVLTGVMDPKRYLENYDSKNHSPVLDPKNYIDSSGPLPVLEEQTDKDFENVDLKKHSWEILEETNSGPRSPEEVFYAASFQKDQESGKDDLGENDFKESSFRETKKLSTTLDAMLGSLDEPMVDVDQFTAKNPVDPVVSPEAPQNRENPEKSGRGTGKSAKRPGKGKKRNELDDLFDTLDFVADILEPPRVIYDEKPANEPKKDRRAARSTETSRRREQFTRAKLRGATIEERSSPRPKRQGRNQEDVGTRQDNNKNTALQNGEQVTGRGKQERTEKSLAKKRENAKNETDKKKKSKHEEKRGERTAAQTNSGSSGSDERLPQLRRSRRIAESSANGRKAILTLDRDGYPEESSADLNQAFVNSTMEDSRAEHLKNGSVVAHENPKAAQQKRKVRRQSSIVKSNKSRSRAKRTGFRTRKDRSFDM